VLVTHDRYLLNRVASTVLGLDGKGHTGQFADYAQWEAWLEEQDNIASGKANQPASLKGTATESQAPPASSVGQKKKLSYLEAREFAAMEQRVEESDARLAAARERVQSPPSPPMRRPSSKRWPSSIRHSSRAMPFMPAGLN